MEKGGVEELLLRWVEGRIARKLDEVFIEEVLDGGWILRSTTHWKDSFAD